MIESVKIESDEDGFHLILEVDPTGSERGALVQALYRTGKIDMALSQDAAWSLVDAIAPIREWRAEGEEQRENVRRGLDHEGRPLDVELEALGGPYDRDGKEF